MTTSELKQSVTFVVRDSENDGPDFTVFGKNGNVHFECRIEDAKDDTYSSRVYTLSPADARTLSAALIDIAALEEHEDEPAPSPATVTLTHRVHNAIIDVTSDMGWEQRVEELEELRNFVDEALNVAIAEKPWVGKEDS